MRTSELFIAPVVRWAVEPGHAESIEITADIARPMDELPRIGDVFTLAHLVDPLSRQPCAVRVQRVEIIWTGGRHIVVPSVVRALAN